MTINELQKKYADFASAKSSILDFDMNRNRDNHISSLDLELLIASSIHKPKDFILIHPEYQISFSQKIHLLYFIYLKKQGYSVATIVGHKEFYGLDFFVNKKVLIPRPDTESMVEEVVEILNNELKVNHDKIVLIDVGTGSGCIPISILKNAKKSVQTFAIDISKSALKVAKKNAKKHNVNINFLDGNLLEPFLSLRATRGSKAIPQFGNANYEIASSVAPLPPRNHTLIITANLPYLTDIQFQSEKSIQKEPKIALVANNNGLALYEELLKQIQSQLLIINCLFFIFLEIDPSQTQAISNLIQQILPKAVFEIKEDLSGRDRLVKIKI